MIKISINGNRSDIAGYISYYSSKEIAPLLEIDEKDIVYESAVVDYFAFGDVDFNTKVEALITISNEYIGSMEEIANILAKYLSGFVSEFTIRYEIVDTNLIFAYKVEGAPSKGCHCHDHDGCHCEDDDECHCHDGCHCEDDNECHCHDGCHCEDDECHCHDGCHCEDDECHCHDGEECKCGDNCTCHSKDKENKDK